MKVKDFVNTASDEQKLKIYDPEYQGVIYHGEAEECDRFYLNKEVDSWDVQEDGSLCLNLLIE